MSSKLVAFTLVLVSVLGQQAISQGNVPADVTAITKVIAKRTTGFNKKDAAAQAQLFTSDADFYASNGTVHVVGIKQVEKVLNLVHNGVLKHATLEQTVTKVSFLSPEIAVVTLDLIMSRPEEHGGTYRNRGLRVMVKKKGEWRIRTSMNQRVIEGRVSPADVNEQLQKSTPPSRSTDSEGVEISDEEAQALLKYLDRNRDGKVTKDEKMSPALASQFDQWDKNNDGTLDLAEFKVAGIRPYSGKLFLEKFDANNDGVLKGNEIQGPLARNWERLDANKDGELTEKELDRRRGFFPAGTFVSGEQRNDPSFSPVVANPRFTKSNAPTVAIDEGHFNFHTMGERFKPFADVLKADGCSVVAHKGRFTAESLNNIDILVIANAISVKGSGSAFTKGEIDVLKSWVNNGGALMLLADHQPYGEFASMLADAFGCKMSDGFVRRGDSGRIVFSYENGQLAKHAITHGLENDKPVTSVKTFTGQALKLSEQFTSLLSLGEGSTLRYDAGERGEPIEPQDVSGWSQGGVAKLGTGRIAIFGEAGMFSAQISASHRKMGMVAEGAEQNQQFLLNVIRWLANSL